MELRPGETGFIDALGVVVWSHGLRIGVAERLAAAPQSSQPKDSPCWLMQGQLGCLGQGVRTPQGFQCAQNMTFRDTRH